MGFVNGQKAVPWLAESMCMGFVAKHALGALESDAQSDYKRETGGMGRKKRKEGLIEGKRMEGRAGTAVRRYFLCSALPARAWRPALCVLRLWAGTDRKRRG